jgi:1,4-alpha-glucan branching enzyme
MLDVPERFPARRRHHMTQQAPAILSDGEIEALLAARHGDAFSALGLHGGADDAPLTLRVLLPGAVKIAVIDAFSGEILADLPQIHPDGLFAGPISGRNDRFAYRLRVEYLSATVEFADAYSFGPILGNLDLHLIAEGNHHRLYERLGAHPDCIGGVAGTRFAVWAPNASAVSVVGDFCDWDGRRLPMRKRVEAGVWEIFVPGVGAGACYKFEIKGPNGEVLPLKADPLAFQAEMRPATASVVCGLQDFHWSDGDWMAGRAARQSRHAPMSVYEAHLGSWARVPEDGDRFLTYDELADKLVPYVRDMGFTHIELLPITEHPFDGSWGYQPIGLFAPTRRHGDPAAFKRFVDACHRAGVGVLLDWVPGHFPCDAHGLGRFDGTALYEHADPRQGFHPDWNTLVYNFGRREVANFLMANALFWLEEYHLDGLRVDAVASMLYLDYSRKAGEWIPNVYGGRENLEAVAFLQRMNALAYGADRGAVTVAEESTSWPGVSRPAYLGGLGFGYKWNMGWMHDSLHYMSLDPVHRRWRHNDLTFSLLYQNSENFVLPLSHDEVVHGKGSLLEKMSGDDWRKFANLRAYLAFMYGHPGKKLLFMGAEIAQRREWSEARSLDWDLLAHAPHAGVQGLVRDLNRLHRDIAALHQRDCEPGGFAWIEADDADNSVFSFLRFGEDGASPVMALCNFTPVPRQGYRFGAPVPGRYAVLLNTDDARYGGTGCFQGAGARVEAQDIPWHGRPYSVCIDLPPLATVMLAAAG